MFQHQGIWLPDGEKHFPEWMTKNGEIVDGRGTYQIRKFRAAMKYVRQFRTAVDVGAHVGLWAMQTLKKFEHVHAFEPVPDFRECLVRNVTAMGSRYLDDLTLYPCALGATSGRIAMRIDRADTGGTHVDAAVVQETCSVHAEISPLDWFELQGVDFLKIDCEGYEHHVVAGARETLERCKPCVIVEQKPHKLGPNFGIKGTPAVDLLKGMGAKVREVISGDYILTW